MQINHRRFRWIVASAGLAIAGGAALPGAAQVAVTVNGYGVQLFPAPIVSAGRVFVPLRGVFERLGASVVYANGTINATGNGRTISLRIGSTQAEVDGRPQSLDVAPYIIGASTYVPLRFVSEALGASVSWDEADRTVSIAASNAAVPQTDLALTNDADIVQPAEFDVDTAPPPLPAYQQPQVPAPDYLWQPGYWAWGPYGYYWVPGTWVPAPEPGYVWTPGYWSFRNGRYGWHPGYWASAVGFYGGVNYGAGYYGRDYVGGRWAGNHFHYNTYVTHVNITVVRNVYVDRRVYITNIISPVSYTGGRSGLQARPNPREIEVARSTHLAPTIVQRRHLETAALDRRLLASVNHAQPPVLTVARPLTTELRATGFVPLRASDRIAAPLARPVPSPVPAEHRMPVAHPVAAPTPRAIDEATPVAKPPLIPSPLGKPPHFTPRPTPVPAPSPVPTPLHGVPPLVVTPIGKPSPLVVPAKPLPAERAPAPVRPSPTPRATPISVPALPQHSTLPLHASPPHRAAIRTPSPAPSGVRPRPHVPATKAPEPR